ncbi:MAG: DnaJ domain-containing protein [Lysobacterales bacterium]
MSSDSMDLVLAVFREPARILEVRERPLPDDVARVIRLAAGENQALERARESTGESVEILLEASIFFLQQILFAPGADSYRVLGAASNIEQARLRENYRWLMKWLHPDRNQDGWEAVYADRVNIAWQDLKTPDRRADYDLRNEVAPTASASTEISLRAPRSAVAAATGPILSGSTVKRLPAIVLGSLGIAAAAVIGLMYWAQAQTQRQLSSNRENAISIGEDAPAAPESASNLMVSLATPVDAPTADTSAGGFESPEVSAFSTPNDPVSPDASSTAHQTEAAPRSPLAMAMAVTSSRDGTREPSGEPGNPPVQDLAVHQATPAGQRSESDSQRVDAGAAAAVLAPADPGGATRAQARADELARAESQASATAQAQAEARARADALARAEAHAEAEALVRGEANSHADARRQGQQGGARSGAATPLSRSSASPATLSVADNAAGKSSAAVESAPTASSLPSAAPPPPLEDSAAPRHRVPGEADARALIKEFASAYAAGDLRRFDQLFNGSRFGLPARDSMRSRFRSTEMRFLEIDQLRLTTDSQSTRASARYRDTYVPRGERRAVTETGTMEWVILLDSAGTARIAELARGS